MPFSNNIYLQDTLVDQEGV